MKVLGNALLGRNFAFYNMRLNDTGLFYVNRSENDTHEIFITSDPAKILSIMDLKFEDIDGVNMERFFEILIGNEYFKTKKFVEDVSEGGSLLLSKFAEYLQTVEYLNTYTRITKERIFEFFGTEVFIEKLHKSDVVLNNNLKAISKFDGSVILKHYPDYDKTRFGITFPYFKENAFCDDIELKYFLKTNTEQTLVSKFMEVTMNA